MPRSRKRKKPVEQAPVKEEAPQTPQDQEIKTKYVKIEGPKFTGQKIVLPVEKPKENKKKRTRIKKQGPGGATPAQNDPKNRNNTRGPQKRGPVGGRGRKQPVVAKQSKSRSRKRLKSLLLERKIKALKFVVISVLNVVKEKNSPTSKQRKKAKYYRLRSS
jgi:translation initiation factor IF-2